MFNTKFWQLKTLLFIGVVTLSCSALQVSAKTAKALPPVSVQLWSVKDALKADFEGTLQSLSAMGFQGVEFAGDFGSYRNDPSKLKRKLSDLNLVASSAHIGFEVLTNESISDTLLFYKTLGVSLLFVPWDERAWHPTGVIALTKQLIAVNNIAQRYDMQIGFHNHDQEFNHYKGATYWDYIATQTPANMPLQLDIGWVNYAGKNPLTYVKNYPQRTISTHLKIRTHKNDDLSPIIGENSYSWQSLIKSLIQHGGTQWLVLEQEEYPHGLTPMQSVAKSKANLDVILQEMAQ
ncbi:sugar phosphate isomerase/epimerase [Pseudoalteromonas sp. K222D]|uniref:sugar phosphate isomerase/epimerase family protein n=1 Tax=Pseudoalteromonas sp. K222D TaxID=2820756 RepID=UPI001AD64911|nr:sugar phosphate isomerase/epimerase [Pseudoalteromonas sp. K222D]MBO7925115.1 sugar phosphate isomerase/epimerase [Pseudoalteromonas sp. K222D]